MCYLVLSDIHGGAEETALALEFYKKFSCDAIVLLGDLLNHGPRNKIPGSYAPMEVTTLLDLYKDKIVAVRGNCDGEVDGMMFSFPCNAPYGYLFIEKDGKIRRIFYTHGHLYDFKTEDGIKKLGLKRGDIVLSGHTHISGVFEYANGIININPGSISIPKGGTAAGFGVIDNDQISLYELNGTKIKEFKLW